MRRWRIVICAIIAINLPQWLICQEIDKTVLNSSVLVKFTVDPTHESVGSGFIILHILSRDAVANKTIYRIFLITNKHVLPPEHGDKEIRVRIAVRSEAGNTDIKEIPIKVLGEDGKYLKTVALHPDKGVDVAAVNVGGELSKEHADLFRQIAETHTALTTELLLPMEQLKEADVGIGTQIYLLGYPSGIYDPRNVSPILRIGIISTEPDKDYSFNGQLQSKYGLPSEIPGFLIDANVYPGSSGSMVIRRTNIVSGFNPGGKASVPYILGIVAKSIPIDDIWGTSRMGLGVVYRADAIKETIQQLLVAH